LYWIVISVWTKMAFSFIMSRHESESPSASEIRDRLFELNRESPKLAFTVEQSANVKFRDHLLTIVRGKLGRMKVDRFGNSWRNEKCIFVLAKNTDLAWLIKQGDMFRPLATGVTSSVFSVKLMPLVSELRKMVNRGS